MIATRPAALAGALAISFSAIFVRLADVDPVTVAFFRAAYALPVLALVWWLVRRRDERTARARWMAVAAGVFLAADLIIWHNAIDLIGAGLATVLANTQVVFVGLAAWMLQRERPTPAAFVLVPVIFIGVVLLSGLGGENAYGRDPVAGVLLGLVTGMCYSGFLFTLRTANRGQRAPSAGPLLDATVGVAAVTLVAGLFDDGFSLRPSWPAHGWLLALALFAQVAGWLLITYALPRLAALETSVILLVQPVGSVLWGRMLFDEVLSPVQWAGVVLVAAGVAVLARLGSVRADSTVRPAAAGTRRSL